MGSKPFSFFVPPNINKYTDTIVPKSHKTTAIPLASPRLKTPALGDNYKKVQNSSLMNCKKQKLTPTFLS